VNLVIYDLDGTLTRRDSLVLYMLYEIRSGNVKAISCIPYYVCLKLKLISNNALKQALAKLLFRGKPVEHCQGRLKAFIDRVMPKYWKQEIIDTLENHRLAGDRIILMSANFQPLVMEMAKTLGVEEVFATQLELKDRVYTGRIIGKVLSGEEKRAKAIEAFDSQLLANATAYADEIGDRFLLEVVGNGKYV